jgi:uncharacterized membrane protein
MKNQRPVLDIPVTPLENLLDLSAFAIAAACWILLGYHYNTLPNEIPQHFNALGQPDRYGDKGTLFLLPSIATVMVLLLHILKRFPHQFNYPYNITPENAPFEYRKSLMILRVVALLAALLLFYCIYVVIQGAILGQMGLGPVFFVLVLAVVIAPFAMTFLWKK